MGVGAEALRLLFGYEFRDLSLDIAIWTYAMWVNFGSQHFSNELQWDLVVRHLAPLSVIYTYLFRIFVLGVLCYYKFLRWTRTCTHAYNHACVGASMHVTHAVIRVHLNLYTCICRWSKYICCITLVVSVVTVPVVAAVAVGVVIVIAAVVVAGESSSSSRRPGGDGQ